MTAAQYSGLYFDMTDEEYHKVLDPKVASYSSSQFKDAKSDIEYFYKKYVTKEIVEEVSSQTQSNFDVGSAYHCLVLEPHLFESKFRIYDGVKRGKEWEAFAEAHKGCTIINKKQYDTAMFIANGAKANTVLDELLTNGQAEVSLFFKLYGLNVKVRADWIDFENGFILDMKSTTGNPKIEDDIKKKIDNMDYDLSAALYLDTFNAYLASKKLPLIKCFKWCFDSKDTGSSKVWTATEEMISVGRRKYIKALNEIKLAASRGWVFEDTDSLIGPSNYAKQDWDVEIEPLPDLPTIPTVEVEEELL